VNFAGLRTRDDPSASGADLTFQSKTDILDGLGPHSTIVSVTATDPNVKNVLLTVRWQNGKRQARLEVVRVDPGDGGSFW
jgi:hypothetical protein